jgi:acetyl-CoA carboxylase carboxyltransferase component
VLPVRIPTKGLVKTRSAVAWPNAKRHAANGQEGAEGTLRREEREERKERKERKEREEREEREERNVEANARRASDNVCDARNVPSVMLWTNSACRKYLYVPIVKHHF